MTAPAPVPSGPLYDFKARVQAAQQAYSEIMRAARKQVDAGNLSEAAYWRISDGDVFAECAAQVKAATEAFRGGRGVRPFVHCPDGGP